MVNISALGWIFLILTLCISTFGASCVIAIVLGFVAFIFGLLTVLYIQSGNFEDTYFNCNLLNNPLATQEIPPGGLAKIVECIKTRKTSQKTDQRVTGSDLIDSSLQEIFGYIIRDYIQPWYGLISTDTEFVENGIRKSAQTLAIHISNRVKEIDWLPYLTTRLVDDAASHIRLFRSSRSHLSQITPSLSPKHKPLTSHRRNKSDTEISSIPADSIDQHFFNLEADDFGSRGRHFVCTNAGKEAEFLKQLMEMLLYVLLPDQDFKCGVVRELIAELAAKGLVKPLVDLVTDSDMINCAILWLCVRDQTLSSDDFLTALRHTDDLSELRYTREILLRELQTLRGRDTTVLDALVKQQISSLQYVQRLIDSRLTVLSNNTLSADAPNITVLPTVHLSLDTILKNNIALSYFIDYVTQMGQEMELFFYLAVEGWRVAAEQQLASLLLGESIDLSLLRESARRICSQYLPGLQLPPPLARALQQRVSDPLEPPSEKWFDEAQKWAHERLGAFLPKFHCSGTYQKLLSEIVDEEIVQPNSAPPSKKHARSHSDVTYSINPVQNNDLERLKNVNFTLSVDIIEAGVMSDKGKTFGIYATQISKLYPSGHLNQYHIYRRYSDFHDLQSRIKDRWPDLSRIAFPGKKPFQTAERTLLERRMRALNHYMTTLCRNDVLESHQGLKEVLVAFTQQEKEENMKKIVDDGSDNNIPLRVLLTLADEVFDLRSRNQWLRRRIVTLLRQIVRAWFGDIVSRRIVEWVADNTSPKNVAKGIKNIQRTVWPGGVKAPARPRRSPAARARTRLAAKVALLSAPALSDELQRLLGQETIRQGLLTVFELVQRPTLNKRLLYVVLEGVLTHLMPEKPIAQIFKQLYISAASNT